MLIDVALNPAEIARLPERDLSRTTCVVFDVLRATSTMVAALSAGAREIRPVSTIEEAREVKAALPEAILGGERHGERIDGFHLGNSPLEYGECADAVIVTTTTNGTVALRACATAETVLVGAVVNLDAVIEHLRSSPPPENVLLVCAGTFTEPALEDVWAAGALIAAFPDAELTDAAAIALAAARLYPEAINALRCSRNGRTLIERGRAAEVEWCAERSRVNIVALMEDCVIRSWTGAAGAGDRRAVEAAG